MNEQPYVVARKNIITPTVVKVLLVREEDMWAYRQGGTSFHDVAVYLTSDDASRIPHDAVVTVDFTADVVISMERVITSIERVAINATMYPDPMRAAWPGWPIDPPPPINGQHVEMEQLDNHEGLKRLRGNG